MDKTPYTDIIELVLALMKSYELDSIYDDAIQNSEDKLYYQGIMKQNTEMPWTIKV